MKLNPRRSTKIHRKAPSGPPRVEHTMRAAKLLRRAATDPDCHVDESVDLLDIADQLEAIATTLRATASVPASVPPANDRPSAPVISIFRKRSSP